jgi:acetylornithine deacetylase/succinyl-diaminopimelate desuccinylase-like protein
VDEYWHTDPFAAERKDGKIYGRGTQDMKCVTAQYLLGEHTLITRPLLAASGIR